MLPPPQAAGGWGPPWGAALGSPRAPRPRFGHGAVVCRAPTLPLCSPVVGTIGKPAAPTTWVLPGSQPAIPASLRSSSAAGTHTARWRNQNPGGTFGAPSPYFAGRAPRTRDRALPRGIRSLATVRGCKVRSLPSCTPRSGRGSLLPSPQRGAASSSPESGSKGHCQGRPQSKGSCLFPERPLGSSGSRRGLSLSQNKTSRVLEGTGYPVGAGWAHARAAAGTRHPPRELGAELPGGQNAPDLESRGWRRGCRSPSAMP